MSSLLETISAAPPDAILGLSAAFHKDPRQPKINLGVGVYKDESGNTPIPQAVKLAEEILLETEKTKGYLPMEGTEAYAEAVTSLLFGSAPGLVTRERLTLLHTPGGTGALRVAADFLLRLFPGRKVWLPTPTWPNHPAIFTAAGMPLANFPYYHGTDHQLEVEPMLEALRQVKAGEIVVLHGCCHNPTGEDPTPETWEAIAQILANNGAIPIVDLAYQGLANGLVEDVQGLHTLARHCPEFFVATSASKNIGLYRERVGALTFVAPNAEQARVGRSHLLLAARTNYSNPPGHGGAIVSTIINDASLRRTWEEELATMRIRINGKRQKLASHLNALGKKDFSHLERQRGMFSYLGISEAQVTRLREEFAVYLVKGSRMNIAGLTDDSFDYLVESIDAVLA